MRKAVAAWTLVRGYSEKATGELIDTETVPISSERGGWKSACEGNSLAAYSTLPSGSVRAWGCNSPGLLDS